MTALPIIPGGMFQKVIAISSDSSGNELNLLAGYVLSGGDDDNRYYGYVNQSGGWYIQHYDDATKTYQYVKGNTDFATNWGNRAILSYDYFDVVFG